jgi:hypothetical protein
MSGKSRKHIKYVRLSDTALKGFELLQQDLTPHYDLLGVNLSHAAAISLLLEWYASKRPFIDFGKEQKELFATE